MPGEDWNPWFKNKLPKSYRKATEKLQESYGDAVESHEKAKTKLKKS